MKKLNKLFLAAGSVAAVAAPVAAVVSCGTTKLTTEDMVNLKPQAATASKTMLVTDGGSVLDKSFNEQAAEALNLIKGRPASTTLAADDYQQPAAHDAGAILKGYQAAATHGATTILAPGFYHVDAINSFIQSHKNAVNFIVADGVVKAGNVASVTFDTKQPAFLAGVLAAQELNKNDATPSAHKVGMWGGGNFAGVTDYMTGFIAGIKYFNDHVKNDSEKIQFAKLSNNKSDYVNSGFEAGKSQGKAQALINAGADVILPVAGGQTADAIDAITANHASQVKLIGVDTDQAKSYNSNAPLFMTSITKNIATAFEDIFAKVSNDTSKQINQSIKGFGETTEGTLENQLVGIVGESALGAELATLKAEAAKVTMTWDEAYDYMSQN